MLVCVTICSNAMFEVVTVLNQGIIIAIVNGSRVKPIVRGKNDPFIAVSGLLEIVQ